MRVPPVVALGGALAVSTGLAALDPARRPSPALRVAGAALAVVGVGVGLAGVAAFRARRTTVDPRRPERAAALVAHGVYRWSRNPMYAGLVAVAGGVAAASGSAAAVAGPLLLAAYLDRVQIPAEERALRQRFGAAFDAYARAVPRWAGAPRAVDRRPGG